MIDLMPKVGMSKFGKCEILASEQLVTNFSCQGHKKLPNFGNFNFANCCLPNIGNAQFGIKPICLVKQMYYTQTKNCIIPKKRKELHLHVRSIYLTVQHTSSTYVLPKVELQIAQIHTHAHVVPGYVGYVLVNRASH